MRRNSKSSKQFPLVTDKQLVDWGMRPRRLRIDRSIFEKSEASKVELANLKARHKRELIAAGFDPKKRMNISEPIVSIS